MAYKGTDSETGEQFTGGSPSKEEEKIGEAKDPNSDAEEWNPEESNKGVWDL